MIAAKNRRKTLLVRTAGNPLDLIKQNVKKNNEFSEK